MVIFNILNKIKYSLGSGVTLSFIQDLQNCSNKYTVWGFYPADTQIYTIHLCKGPYFYILYNEIFFFGKYTISKCFTRMASSVIKISI